MKEVLWDRRLDAVTGHLAIVSYSYVHARGCGYELYMDLELLQTVQRKDASSSAVGRSEQCTRV